jgi:hypothetical protein
LIARERSDTIPGVIVRCVAGVFGAWEISTGAACGCVFQWRDVEGRGVVFWEPSHCQRCRAAVAEYAARRGFALSLDDAPRAERVSRRTDAYAGKRNGDG